MAGVESLLRPIQMGCLGSQYPMPRGTDHTLELDLLGVGPGWPLRSNSQ